ncbi:hypothetical protein, partial [Thermincola ferriacetica]|uniref:hypothetical protein n=1 Tax=Thermincola ferriacetica TaxID=281456 RepID=UPI001A9A2D23
PTVRDRRGASGNVAYSEKCARLTSIPTKTEKKSNKKITKKLIKISLLDKLYTLLLPLILRVLCGFCGLNNYVLWIDASVPETAISSPHCR